MSIPLTFVKIPFLIFSLYLLPGGFNGKKPDLNRSPGISRDTAVQNQPVEFDHFEFTEGLEVADLKGVRDSYRRRRVIQLCDSTRKGRAEDYFFEESAKYDITLYYVDGTGGRSEVDLAVNGRPVGNIEFGSSNSFK